MAEKVIMPKQGLQITEGTITKWLVAEGEKVIEGEPLFEMETDKLTIEIMSPASGTLLKILREEGEVVPVIETIAIIGVPGEDISELIDAEHDEDGVKQDIDKIPENKTNDPLDRGTSEDKEVERPGRIFITLRAKKLAERAELDISGISGTGPNGLIIERDVKEFLNNADKRKYTPVAKKMANEYGVDLPDTDAEFKGRIYKEHVQRAIAISHDDKAPGRGSEIVPITRMRKVISERMMQSLHGMAQANHRIKVDVSEILKMREKLKADGVEVSINSILVKAVSKALLEFPIMNSSLIDEGILIKNYVNMGVAVAVPDGLIVPVIKDADLLSLVEINDTLKELIDKARTGAIEPDDCSGGTFTITNLGMFDIDEFTAIINPPESGILAVGKIDKTPVAVGEKIELRPIMVLSLTYDHRIIVGAPAAQFLQRVKGIISNPYLML
ncbi:MAG: 2-oxo acid dehydrogenase subunit E2 [Thermoanaerobacteraceae bacterium]|nr:2-oxo acid dehydrogenase subunit E2 [Thermoanaerobacteraceae bacterium]